MSKAAFGRQKRLDPGSAVRESDISGKKKTARDLAKILKGLDPGSTVRASDLKALKAALRKQRK